MLPASSQDYFVTTYVRYSDDEGTRPQKQPANPRENKSVELYNKMVLLCDSSSLVPFLAVENTWIVWCQPTHRQFHHGSSNKTQGGTYFKQNAYNFMVYPYKKDRGREHVKIELDVQAKNKQGFKVKVAPDGLSIEVTEKVSPHFFSLERNETSNRNQMDYNDLSAPKQAYEGLVNTIRNKQKENTAIWSDPP